MAGECAGCIPFGVERPLSLPRSEPQRRCAVRGGWRLPARPVALGGGVGSAARPEGAQGPLFQQRGRSSFFLPAVE
jgi:hypothetical protein